MTWKKYFKLPFKLDEFTKGYVWDANNEIVIDFPKDTISDKLKEHVVNILNSGNKDYTIQIPSLSYKQGEFYCGDKYIFQIRAWGHLTSPSCCNLSNEKACKVQDELGEYILKLLN